MRIAPTTRLIALFLLIGTGAANARVFLRWKATADMRRSLEATGGLHAYSADVEVNGSGGGLSVFSFEKPIRFVLADLTRVFEIDASRQLFNAGI